MVVLFLMLFSAVSADLKSVTAASLYPPATWLHDPPGDIDAAVAFATCEVPIVENALAVGETFKSERAMQLLRAGNLNRTCAAHA